MATQRAVLSIGGVILLGIMALQQLFIADRDPLRLLLVLGIFGGGVALLLAINRQYFLSYLSPPERTLPEPTATQSLLAEAIELKKSPRITMKAKAQKLFRQIATAESLSEGQRVFVMLNLCELLLDEVRAYGELEAFQEADALSTRIYEAARQRDSASLLVEALLLRSSFALLNGSVAEADNLLEHAIRVAASEELPELVEKVGQEKIALEEEVSRWEELISSAAPLRDRLKQVRLQNYIQNAVRVIELEERTT
ncbi:MAG: hypothetical protein ACE5OZ_22775 [Candidatus Heimdallarchaeota archaeon]